jgi:hypothetical protein
MRASWLFVLASHLVSSPNARHGVKGRIPGYAQAIRDIVRGRSRPSRMCDMRSESTARNAFWSFDESSTLNRILMHEEWMLVNMPNVFLATILDHFVAWSRLPRSYR